MITIKLVIFRLIGALIRLTVNDISSFKHAPNDEQAYPETKQINITARAANRSVTMTDSRKPCVG